MKIKSFGDWMLAVLSGRFRGGKLVEVPVEEPPEVVIEEQEESRALRAEAVAMAGTGEAPGGAGGGRRSRFRSRYRVNP